MIITIGGILIIFVILFLNLCIKTIRLEDELSEQKREYYNISNINTQLKKDLNYYKNLYENFIFKKEAKNEQ